MIEKADEGGLPQKGNLCSGMSKIDEGVKKIQENVMPNIQPP
jgi:hypothetical protein